MLDLRKNCRFLFFPIIKKVLIIFNFDLSIKYKLDPVCYSKPLKIEDCFDYLQYTFTKKTYMLQNQYIHHSESKIVPMNF